MKLSLVVLVILLGLPGATQPNNTYIHAEYEVFCDTYRPTRFVSVLSAANNVSIYQELSDTAQPWAEKTKPKPEGVKTIEATGEYSPYYKIDRKKKEMFFFAPVTRFNFLVKDIYHDFKWDITTESKKIGGYTCLKATTSYRGREWTAWFAPGIPVPFGPWKLHGLPGLILEAYDTNEKYTFKLLKIAFTKDAVLEKDFASLMEKRNTEAITYKQLLEQREEMMDNMVKSNPNSNATITRMPVPRNGEELTFEWE